MTQAQKIHPTAQIDPKAELDSSVEIGAFTVVGPNVRMGAGTRVGHHTVIEGYTTLGRDNSIGHFASVGGRPQDMKYRDEPTQLIVGDRNTIRWDCAESHAPGIIRRLLEEGIPEGVLFNLNFPNAGPSEVEGVSVTVQGRRDQELVKLEPRKDGRGNPYYWIAFQRSRKEPANGTDLRAMAEKRISVTPLELDLTHEPTLTRFARVFA